MQCCDASLYTGITTDVQRRIHEHNETPKGARYTRGRRPVQLVASWRCESHSQAARLEYAFKQLSRSQKLRWLKRDEIGGLLDDR